MDPTEITKHLPEVVSVAKVAAASVPFTAIVKRMLGPAADEVAEQLANEIRVYRYGRSMKLLEKAERMAKDAGFTPQAVPIKLLFPLLEGASFEDDEELHTMWAALLANAASPDHAEQVRPGFIAILKQMAPDEAGLLVWFSRYCESHPHVPPDLITVSIGLESVVGRKVDFDSLDLSVCLDRLMAEGMLTPSGNSCFPTALASAFLAACQPPKPKS